MKYSYKLHSSLGLFPDENVHVNLSQSIHLLDYLFINLLKKHLKNQGKIFFFK